jgi:hypothetical protein
MSQLSFLMSYIKSGSYSCSCEACSKSELSTEEIYMTDLKGCFGELQELLFGPF